MAQEKLSQRCVVEQAAELGSAAWTVKVDSDDGRVGVRGGAGHIAEDRDALR